MTAIYEVHVRRRGLRTSVVLKASSLALAEAGFWASAAEHYGELVDGDAIMLVSGARVLRAYPPDPAPGSREDIDRSARREREEAAAARELEALREGAPKGRRRVFK